MEALAENQEVERSFDNQTDKPKKLDLAEIFKLRFHNRLSLREIASKFGVHHSTIDNMLQTYTKLIKNPDETNVYDMNRAGILTALEFEIIKQMSDETKLKSASFNNLAYGASQINNMIRLEKGQPTAITEHLDADLGGMIDQLCGLKSAGSGSVIDVTPAASSPSSPDDDILSSLLPADPVDPGTFTPDQSTTPAADRSTCGNLEVSNLPVKPTKSGNARKPRTAKPSKSATNSRKQNSCKITASPDSKVDTVKQGTNTIPAADTTSAAGKEWYE